MPPSYLAALRKGMAFIDSTDMVEAVTVNGHALTATVSELKIEQSLEQGGIVNVYGLIILINKAQVNFVPARGQPVIYNGTSYKIDVVQSDLVSWTLTVINPNV